MKTRMKRDVAIDYLRSGVTVLVVAHHSGLAYTTFSYFNPVHYALSVAPVVDKVRCAPLDYLVAWNDTYILHYAFVTLDAVRSAFLALAGRD